MSDWYAAAAAEAARHPTIVGLRQSAQGQRESEAESLEATASYLEAEMIARSGVAAGEYRAVCVGHTADVGRYIRVETDQGWNPDYFWCETPLEVSPLSGS